MIEIKSVSKNYGNVKSLDDVTAEVKKGSIFGLIGSNGSGKSTLLRIMCGIFQSDGGIVEYEGKPIYENKEMKKGLKNLENTLNNSTRNSDGSLKFVTSRRSNDDESYFGKGGWVPDI